MTLVTPVVARLVIDRAHDRCEVCGMHQCLQGATFHVDHLVPRSLGGPTMIENLAWICPSCNLHKSNRVVAVDPHTGQVVPLFNPRTDDWSGHFCWRGYEISALTPVGRATIAALDLNHPRRIRVRLAEEKFDLFPPSD